MQKRNQPLIVVLILIVLAAGSYVYVDSLTKQPQEPTVEAAESPLFDAIKEKPKDLQEKIIAADILAEKLLQAVERDDYAAYSALFSDKIPENLKQTPEKFARLRANVLERGGKYLGKENVQANYLPPVRLSYQGNFEKNAYANLIILETRGKKSDQKALSFSITFFDPEKIKTAGALAKTMLTALSSGDAATFKSHLDRQMQSYCSDQAFEQLQAILRDGAPADYTAPNLEKKLVDMREKNNGSLYLYDQQTPVGKFRLELGLDRQDPPKVKVWQLYALPSSAFKEMDQVTNDFLNGICKNDLELFYKHLSPELINTPNLNDKFLKMHNQVQAETFLAKDFEYYTFQENGFVLQYNVLFPGREEYSQLTVLIERGKDTQQLSIADFSLKHYLGNLYDNK